jgi:hypothetical protein
MCRKILQSTPDTGISNPFLWNNRLLHSFLNPLAPKKKIKGTGDSFCRLPGGKWPWEIFYRKDQGQQSYEFFGFSSDPGWNYLNPSFNKRGWSLCYPQAQDTTKDHVVFNRSGFIYYLRLVRCLLTRCPSFAHFGGNIDVCTEFVATNYPQSLWDLEFAVYLCR